MTVIYGSDVANGTLATASTMSSTTGGTEVSQQTTVTGTSVWVEVVSRAATIASVTSIPAPSGKGWVFQPGAGSFASGNWSAIVTLSVTSPGTADLTIRFYRFDGTTYHAIGSINKTGVVAAKTAYSFTPTSMSSNLTFSSTDLLYVDLPYHDTTGADDNPVVYESNSATQGVASDMQVTTTAFTPVTPALSTSPTTLTFNATQGGSSPASQNDTLNETAGAPTAWTSSISYGSGSGWLGISPSSGNLSANGNQVVSYTCTTGSLTAGTYTATVTYTATTGGAQATVGVTFIVAAPTPVLSTSPTTLTFNATQGGSSPASQNDTLSETAGAATAWTSSITYGSGSGWLGISPSSGNLGANGNQVVAFTCTTGALTAGTYTATVTYTATTGGAQATVGVTFVVAAPTPVLATSPTTLTFTAIQGGSNPTSQNDTLSETAGGATAWTSSISYTSGSGWLGISPSSGNLSANGNQVVSFTCTTGALTHGTYTATVTYTATTGGAQATVGITFTVNAAPAKTAAYIKQHRHSYTFGEPS